MKELLCTVNWLEIGRKGLFWGKFISYVRPTEEKISTAEVISRQTRGLFCTRNRYELGRKGRYIFKEIILVLAWSN